MHDLIQDITFSIVAAWLLGLVVTRFLATFTPLHRMKQGLRTSLVTSINLSPVARAGLLERKVRVIYGGISQRETLLHAGVNRAEVLICTVPDSFLKGITNERLVRVLRELNPKAKIISTTDVLSKVDTLLAAGADYVSVARLREASDLLEAVRTATDGLLDEKRAELKTILGDRREVLG